MIKEKFKIGELVKIKANTKIKGFTHTYFTDHNEGYEFKVGYIGDSSSFHDHSKRFYAPIMRYTCTPQISTNHCIMLHCFANHVTAVRG